MTDLYRLKDDLVTANRILADNNVLDSFGHVSIRHPDNPDHFLMARARAPMCVEIDDIMEFTLDGTVVGPEPGKPLASTAVALKRDWGPNKPASPAQARLFA